MKWFNTYFIDVLKNHYVDFTGKATRKQFWFFILIEIIILAFVTLIAFSVSNLPHMPYYKILISLLTFVEIFVIAMVIPYLAIGARRLRDAGLNPFWLFLLIIPYISNIGQTPVSSAIIMFLNRLFKLLGEGNVIKNLDNIIFIITRLIGSLALLVMFVLPSKNIEIKASNEKL